MAINYNEEEFGLQLPDTNQGGITDVAFAPGSALDKQINKLNTLEQMGYPQQNLQNLKDMDMKQFKETGTPLSLPRDQYAMAISNYDQLFGPKTMTDSFGTSHNLAAVNRPDLYTGDLMAKTGQPLRDPFAPLKNEFNIHGVHPSTFDPYGNKQMALENPDVDPYEDPKGLRALFQNLDPSSWGKALKTKASTGWNFAQQLPGMAMSAFGGMPGAAMGLLSKLAKPDTPYQKFQKQMFENMGWQGESNKDPWGKNINSAFGDYDVTEQWGDLMGTKIGEKYGYADAFADGVLDDAELAKMQDLGLKGWQLNRAIGLSTAAKKAQAWQDKKAQEKILTNQMTNTGGGGYKPGDATTNWNPNIKGTTNFHPSQGNKKSSSGSKKSSSGGYQQKQGSHHFIRGGRVGYGNGGLATLFTRRG